MEVRLNKIKKIILGSVIIISLFVIGLVIYLYVTRPMISDENLVIYTGYSKEIHIYGRENVKLWISEDEKVATVNEGVVTAVNPGKTNIIVETENKHFECKVEVREAVSPKLYEIAEEEKNWLFEQQLSNGAFCNRAKENGKVSINPYFCSSAVVCMLQCDLTNEELLKIKNYLIWHFEHLNYTEDYNGVIGTIYDYNAIVEDGKVIQETTDEKYDSTDSYAAMFLVALWEYYEATQDEEFIIQNADKIKLVFEVMISTLSNGYSYCKPDYEIVYLMDNAEVYAGLMSGEKIFEKIINDEDYAKKASKIKKNFLKNFENVWWRKNHYSPYLDKENKNYDEEFSWDKFYPDAVSQLSVIIYNFADEKECEIIYDKFCDTWEWEEMEYMEEADNFYWGMIMYAAVVMKDENRAFKYLELYREKTVDREYPLILSDCAWVTLATEKLADYYREIEMS